MKPVLLLAIVLLQLSFPCVQLASLKDKEEEGVKSQIDESILKADLGDVLPPLVKDSIPIEQAKSERQLEQEWRMSHGLFVDNVNLQWVPWNGSLPDGAVSILNGYASRTDYVCKFNCEAGFYNPNKGPYCLYPYADKEFYASTFDILVNRDNFEFTEWLSGSYGSVPDAGIRTCAGVGIYVGKNKYGLGKVVPQHGAFFLPWEGKEYWYKKYQVISINTATYSQHISHVVYGIDQIKFFQHPPETLKLSTVVNNECHTVKKTVILEKTTEIERHWDIGRSVRNDSHSSISAQIPQLGVGSVEFTKEKSWQFSQGTSTAESTTHKMSIEVSAPPGHSCAVQMEGKKIKLDIPFTARLSRTYINGETQWTSISGKYDGVQVGELKAIVERCEPIADAKPCPAV